MRIKFCVWGIILLVVAHLNGGGLLCQATVTGPAQATVTDPAQATVTGPAQPTEQAATKKETSSGSLEEILKKDATSEGVICNVLSGLTLCYKALANLLLYPIFSFLLLALSLGAIVLAWFWIKKIKEERPIFPSWVIATSLYLLCYFDLFLVVFQKKKVLLLFLELEKDLLLVTIAMGMGYVAGRFSSSKSFEEDKLP